MSRSYPSLSDCYHPIVAFATSTNERLHLVRESSRPSSFKKRLTFQPLHMLLVLRLPSEFLINANGGIPEYTRERAAPFKN